MDVSSCYSTLHLEVNALSLQCCNILSHLDIFTVPPSSAAVLISSSTRVDPPTGLSTTSSTLQYTATKDDIGAVFTCVSTQGENSEERELKQFPVYCKWDLVVSISGGTYFELHWTLTFTTVCFELKNFTLCVRILFFCARGSANPFQNTSWGDLTAQCFTPASLGCHWRCKNDLLAVLFSQNILFGNHEFTFFWRTHFWPYPTRNKKHLQVKIFGLHILLLLTPSQSNSHKLYAPCRMLNCILFIFLCIFTIWCKPWGGICRWSQILEIISSSFNSDIQNVVWSENSQRKASCWVDLQCFIIEDSRNCCWMTMQRVSDKPASCVRLGFIF